jgi:hypothetical protein
MRITKTVILAIAILFTASFALAMGNVSTPEPIVFPSFMIIPTALAPAATSPLADYDLIPRSVSRDSYYVNFNQEAQLASVQFGQRYLVRNVRAAATGDVLFKVNLGAMVALNVADYFSTNACLKHAGLQEGNPLMRPFTKSPALFAAAKIGITTLSYFAMKSLYKKNKPLAWIVSFASNLALSYVISNNIRLHSLAK